MNTANAKNRGYFKIEGAARAFNFDFKGKVVLDIGSSTGGFTEYALDRGAKKVIAVEKGSHQMKAPLRFDPRIDLHEKTDIFDFRITEMPLEGHPQLLRGRSEEPREDGRDERPEKGVSVILADGRGPMKKHICAPDVIVADVSFISLTKILAYAKMNLSRPTTDFLVMLKPQFEAHQDQLHNGIVKNETIRREIIKNFEQWLKNNSFIVINKHDNQLSGKNGNKERFYYLKLAK